MITRRAILVGVGAAPLSSLAGAETSIETLPTLIRREATLSGRRPSVILLHGSRGIEINPRAYERYEDALLRSGIDVYILRYMTRADTAALDPQTTSSTTREAYDAGRFDWWADTVSAAVGTIHKRDDCSGRLGLLGFSLGGYIAANAAARDQRVAALAVLYGGMPDATVAKVKHLPPTIELHGDADTVVAIEPAEI